MDKGKLAVAALLCFLIGGTMATAQELTVTGEKKAIADFSKYKSYSWMDARRSGRFLFEYVGYRATIPAVAGRRIKKEYRDYREEIVYSYSYFIPAGDSGMNEALMKSVNIEMTDLGYKKDDVKPDLLVAYKIFDGSTHIKKFDTPPLVAGIGKTQVRQDTISYEMEPGTVIISIVEVKRGEIVWEGTASGLADKDDLLSESKVRHAVNLIFKEYMWRGNRVTMN